MSIGFELNHQNLIISYRRGPLVPPPQSNHHGEISCTSDGSIMPVPPLSSPWWIHVVYVGDILFISKSSFTSCQVLTTWLRQCVHGQGIFCSSYFCLTISMKSSTPMMNVGENSLPLGIQDLSICCSKGMQSLLDFRPLGGQWQN